MRKITHHRHIQTSKAKTILFLENLSSNLSTCLKDCDNTLLLGHFNMTPRKMELQHVTDSFNLENFIHEATCFKGFSRSHHDKQKILPV